MASPQDFPGNCATNVYTLTDFGEIAYIVCTVANPPTQDPSSFNNTPENALARLRRTERQFREASILAALDVDTRQLFTFYKKVDIANAKDQKALLGKFGFVLRNNTCTIAYKTAARLPDLMKPEQAQLYRLFATAIISSVKILPPVECEVHSLGANLYLIEGPPSDSGFDGFASSKELSLHRIGIQVIASGHIILTIAREDCLRFMRLSDAIAHGKFAPGVVTSLALYLAPVGVTARVTGSGPLSALTRGRRGLGGAGDESTAPASHLKLWKESVARWLRDQFNITNDFRESQWIEAQIAVRSEGLDPGDSPQVPSPGALVSGDVSWKTLFWPAELCFTVDSKQPVPGGENEDVEDPLHFVQTWINGTIGGSAISTLHPQQNSYEDEDEPLFTEEGAFDDPEHFQPFGPPAFPASQTIYPTPPDALMTHTTPGFSSVDGIPVTPANPPREAMDTHSPQDEDMADFDETSAPGAGVGYYDEDLFEEMPDDNFGQEGAGDEPNWDFFDQPGIDSKDASAIASHRANEDGNNGALSHQAPVSEQTGPETTMISPKEHTKKDEKPNAVGVGSNPGTQDKDRGAPRDTHSAIDPKGSEAISDPFIKPRPVSRENVKEPKSRQEGRRRSSVYDGFKSSANAAERDNRYSADGAYWFDPNPNIAKSNQPVKMKNVYQAAQSSLSDSDDSSTSSFQMSLDRGSTNVGLESLSRQWTEYHAEPSPIVKDLPDEEDETAYEQEIQLLLSSLLGGLKEPPSRQEFCIGERARDGPVIPSQKLSRIAQILVDQVSQSSLIAKDEPPFGLPAVWEDQLHVLADLSGINTTASPSTLYQLLNIKTDANQSRPQGRLFRIPPPQVRVKRTEQPLTAAVSILGFWDTLNLQPEHGPKNVTTFCIHPNGRNVADGCSNFLRRMTDAYTACAFGAHKIGRISGFADDGLLAWSSNAANHSSLQSTCKKLGNALSLSSDINGVVVVYVISEGEKTVDYLKICSAFCTLFESFVQSSTEKKTIVDIALQIIPRSFVADSETLVIPTQAAYIRLGLEVYNRLPPVDTKASPGTCGSAVTVAHTATSVSFRLTSEPSSPLNKNGPCLHVAYSSSADGRWIVVAWTDECGNVALTMSYCLQFWNSSSRRPRQDVFGEICDTSHDLMGRVQGTWRLCVAKVGAYDSDEITEWREVTERSGRLKKKCMLMMLMVRTHPLLKLLWPGNLGRNAPSGVGNLYGTPASTPQAGITSPDQLVPATPTPGGSGIVSAPTPPEHGYDPNTDGDLTLVDLAEESWSIVLPYGVDQTSSMTELRPTAVTGLLMKRRGIKGEDGHVSIEISLVSTILAPAKSEELLLDELLEDIIKQYRGLVTLSVTRGCIDPGTDCLPWHIATAIRGAQTLGSAM